MMTEVVRVAVLSDSRLFQDVISERLASEDGIKVVGTAFTVEGLFAPARSQPIDVVLLHVAGDSTAAAEAVWNTKLALRSARVVAFGIDAREAEMIKCIEAGASACLENDTPYRQLLQTVRAVAEYRTTASLHLLARVMDRIQELGAANERVVPCEGEPLSFRELEVANLLAQGLINKQIAKRLSISLHTVKNHVHSILRKLNVKRRIDVTPHLERYLLDSGGEAASDASPQ